MDLPTFRRSGSGCLVATLGLLAFIVLSFSELEITGLIGLDCSFTS